MIQRLLTRAGRSFNQSLVEEMRAQRKKTEDRVLSAIRTVSAKSEKVAAKQQRTLEALASDLTRQRVEIRLWSARSRQAHGRAEGGQVIALTSSELPPLDAGADNVGADLQVGPSPDQVGLPTSASNSAVPKDSILELDACPVCTSAVFSPVCEYNKLLLLESGVDDEARVYNYALCHDCGVVYARRRPIGPRYAYLLDRFEVTLGRAQDGIPRTGHVALRSGALTEEERSALRERVGKGVFVSEHSGLPRREYLPALLQDRMATSVHVELLGSLLPLKAPRVLELRPRLGSIGAALRRLYDAEVYGMPLFDGQQFLIGETYGIPADHKVDYDHFSIPYEGQFDLIVANHMLTHALHPREFFSTLHERLKPGGHVYLYNEPDDREFLEDDGTSMINTLNAFHMQTFDSPSIVRALGACGFEPVFVTHQGDNLIALARAGTWNASWPRMEPAERDRRLAAYQRARDAAILRLPDRLRGHFAHEWDAVVERSFAAGVIDFDERGRLRMVKLDRGEGGDG